MIPYCFHGWGFPASIFQNFGSFNRGYFGNESTGEISPLVVTHSFGLHLVSKNVWKQCKKLVVLSGFIRLSDRVKIRAMRGRLRREPESLLRAFYAEAGYHGNTPWLEEAVNVALLDEDLCRMEEVLDLEPLISIPEITLFQAKGDRIVAEERGFELLRQFPHAKLIEIEGSHMSTLTAWIEQQPSKKPSQKL
jgi:hypothetical protein